MQTVSLSSARVSRDRLGLHRRKGRDLCDHGHLVRHGRISRRSNAGCAATCDHTVMVHSFKRCLHGHRRPVQRPITYCGDPH